MKIPLACQTTWMNKMAGFHRHVCCPKKAELKNAAVRKEGLKGPSMSAPLPSVSSSGPFIFPLTILGIYLEL